MKEFTKLQSGAKFFKNDPLIHAIGEIEELNASIGVVLAYVWDHPDAMELLMEVQNDLVVAVNDLNHCEMKYHQRLKSDRHRSIQAAADKFNEQLVEPKTIVIPGGIPASAHCHLARAICRRAERAVHGVTFNTNTNYGINGNIAVYLDTLSNVLFVLARLFAPSDKLWEPHENGTEPVVAGTAEVPQQP